MLFSAFRFGKTYGDETPRHPLKKVVVVLGFVILGIIAVTALAIVFGLVVQWLWNALMPVIFNLPEVTYWQAVGLVVLGHITTITLQKSTEEAGTTTTAMKSMSISTRMDMNTTTTPSVSSGTTTAATPLTSG